MSSLLALRFGASLKLARTVQQRALKGGAYITLRKLSFKRKKSTTVEPVKTDYEIEYDKFVKQDKYERKYGFIPNDPYLDKAVAHMLMFMAFSLGIVFFPLIMMYSPDHRHRMVEWRRYEALKLMEEREAKGEMLIDVDFAPRDQIEAMVPPPGDWEEQWLREQPAVSVGSKHWWYTQAPSW